MSGFPYAINVEGPIAQGNAQRLAGQHQQLMAALQNERMQQVTARLQEQMRYHDMLGDSKNENLDLKRQMFDQKQNAASDKMAGMGDAWDSVLGGMNGSANGSMDGMQGGADQSFGPPNPSMNGSAGQSYGPPNPQSNGSMNGSMGGGGAAGGQPWYQNLNGHMLAAMPPALQAHVFTLMAQHKQQEHADALQQQSLDKYAEANGLNDDDKQKIAAKMGLLGGKGGGQLMRGIDNQNTSNAFLAATGDPNSPQAMYEASIIAGGHGAAGPGARAMTGIKTYGDQNAEQRNADLATDRTNRNMKYDMGVVPAKRTADDARHEWQSALSARDRLQSSGLATPDQMTQSQKQVDQTYAAKIAADQAHDAAMTVYHKGSSGSPGDAGGYGGGETSLIARPGDPDFDKGAAAMKLMQVRTPNGVMAIDPKWIKARQAEGMSQQQVMDLISKGQ